MTERLTDDDRIRRGLAQAALEGTEISAITARIIASQWHSGQASAFCSFASTGAIDTERLTSELVVDYVEAETEEDRVALDALASYLRAADGVAEDGNRPPVPNWHEDNRW